MDLTYYVGARFECACGAHHELDREETPVIRELPRMRLVVGCPQGAITCIKVKGIIRFKGLESLFGVRPH